MTPLAGGTTGGVHQVSVLLAIFVSLGTLTVLLVKASAFSFTIGLFLGMTIYFMLYCPRTILRRRRGCFSLAETPPSRSSCFQALGRPQLLARNLYRAGEGSEMAQPFCSTHLPRRHRTSKTARVQRAVSDPLGIQDSRSQNRARRSPWGGH